MIMERGIGPPGGKWHWAPPARVPSVEVVDIATAQKLWDPEPGWLNTASYGLPPRPAFEALQAALDDWRVGRTSWEPWNESTTRARASFARLIGVDAGDVAVGSTV